jgi:ribosomal protein S18 acetylase RimI-like enzyme
MKIYKAGLNDIEDLVQLRVDYLRMDKGKLSDEEEKAIRSQSKIYFAKHIHSGDFLAFIAQIDGKIASAAFLLVQDRPAIPPSMTGITGTLFNVITYPEYRKRGIASRIVQTIIREAEDMGLSSIDLSSTEEGKTLYEKIGFVAPTYTSMNLKLKKKSGGRG